MPISVKLEQLRLDPFNIFAQLLLGLLLFVRQVGDVARLLVRVVALLLVEEAARGALAAATLAYPSFFFFIY